MTAVVQGLTVSAGSGLYGILMHMIATGVLVLVSGMIYNRKKTKATAVFGLTAGMAAMAVVMVGANLLITPMFMGVSKDVVWKLMPFIIGFNVIKAGINGAVTFLCISGSQCFCVNDQVDESLICIFVLKRCG